MKKLIYLFVLVMLLNGCAAAAASIDKTMESWVGRNANDLVPSWGPPQQVVDDGQGGRILIYTYTASGYPAVNYNAYGGTYNVYGAGQDQYDSPRTSGYATSRTFWVDSNNRIYKWAWKGL